MTQKTSIEAYWIIRERGLLSKRRFEVYDEVFNYGPISADDVHKRLSMTGVCTRAASLTPRFAELEKLGVIKVFDHKKNPETGMMNLRWVATEKLPGKLEKRESAKEKIKRLERRILELESIIETLNCDF